MIKNILISLLLVNSLALGALQTDAKPEKIFTDKELLPLFYSMMKKISKHYYFRDRLDLSKIKDRLNEIKEEGGTLSQEAMYTLVNLSLDGESGFYTKEKMQEKFAFLMDNSSTYDVKRYDDVTYVNLQKFTYDDVGKFREYLKANQPKKLILDLRNNFYTSSLNISALANFFMSEGIIYSRRYLDSKGNYKSSIMRATKNSTLLTGAEIIILINEKTASAAEAMAHSVKFETYIEIVGQDSAGKSNSYFIERFNGDDFLVLVDAEYFYQRYKILHNIGLNPEGRVKEDNAGVDKTLVRAIRTLKEKK